jgi:filamentous hemagglutinin family protein
MIVLAFLPAEAALAQSAGTILPKGTVPTLRGIVSGNVVVQKPVATPTGALLTIDQIDPRVVIDWSQFNVANGSVVKFVQPSSSAAALNRIYSADPTIIQGQVISNGQIFLINQNGILFDRGAQINVNTLYASTLNISNAQFEQGVVPAGSLPGSVPSVATFTGGYDNSGNTNAAGASKPILVGAYGPAGAAGPSLSAASGGAIVLIAPMINNQSGIISSPDGQVILAAGNSVYLQFPVATDNTLRGLAVEVTAANGPVNLTSLVTNSGVISAERGNVTIAALAVNQAGVISASTALLKNGSIYLEADTINNVGTVSSTITLAPGSLIETPLDTTDTTTLPASQAYDPYRAVTDITAGTIIDNGTIHSPAGVVNLTAQSTTGVTDPRVYLGAQSVIDVAGDNVNLPESNNLLTFKVTGNELNNSPDQKGKLLEGSTVTVDLNAGSTILDLLGYQSARPESLLQEATSAGSVNLASGGDIIQRLGSTINANAGSTTYAGGKDPVSLLLASNGSVYSITNAPEDLTYVAVLGTFSVSHPRWGLNDVFTGLTAGIGNYQSAYTNGGTGGNISILPTTGLVLDGAITASTQAGVNQTTNAPRGGTLTIGQLNPSAGSVQDFGVNGIVFASGSLDTLGPNFQPTDSLSQSQIDTTRISSDLFPASAPGAGGTFEQSGFDTVAIGANQSIAVPQGVSLAAGLDGTFSLYAQSISVAGQIKVPAGSVSLNSVSTIAAAPAGNAYTIDVKGTISTAGQWSNDFAVNATPLPSSVAGGSTSGSSPTINGGSITIDTQNNVGLPASVDLESSSLLDVSAGGSVAKSGKVTGGNGGSIDLSAQNIGNAIGATLTLDGTLRGYGFSKGGKLSVGVEQATISNGATGSGNFAPQFFDQGGFSSYAVDGIAGVTVAPGTLVAPQQLNYVLTPLQARSLASGGEVASVAEVETLPNYQRGPVSLALSTELGQATVGAGATIRLDPTGTFSLSGGTGGLDLEGAIVAHGGTVSLSAAGAASVAPPDLVIGSGASIDVSGTFVAGAPNAQALVQGTVLGGGKVSITANNADLVAKAGSVINVSGASQVIDQLQDDPTHPVLATTYTSDAGLVSVSINDQITLDSTLIAHASGFSAGGTFELSYLNRNDFIDSSTQRRIVVTQAPSADVPNPNYSDALIALQPLLAAGFDKLSLSAEDDIQFTGGSVNANFVRGVFLNSQQFSVASGTKVSLSGAEMMLSNTFGQRVPNTSGTGTLLDNTLPSVPIATYAGTGILDLHGDNVDLLGSLTINGVAQTTIDSNSDIRLTGRVVGLTTSSTGASLIGGLTTVGDLTMRGAQVYPTTLSSFNIAIADGLSGTVVPGGEVTFAGNGARPDLVLSAGGTLTVSADTIEQGGVVKAPLGELNLSAVSQLDLLPGSTTSTSAQGAIIPYGGTFNGITWYYASINSPLFNSLSAPPQQSMNLTGKNVSIDHGATVNISGGGDILGIEFVPGSGGSTDALAQSNTYAIIPSAMLSAMPVDTAIATIQNLGENNPATVYNSIHIATNGVVPAGNYVLLPGYYALLPGAYLVQVQSGSQYASLQPGQEISLANGLNVIPAWQTVSGTSIRNSQTIGLIVQPGANANKLADYNQFGASFFAKADAAAGLPAPVLPSDAGRLTLAAGNSLTLGGTLLTTPGTSSGSNGEVDITGQYIAVVDHTGQTDVGSQFLQVSASGLSDIDGSVLIGGTRANSAGGITITPTTTDIVVANSSASPLSDPELMMVATDSITFDAGSVVMGSGNQRVPANNITINASQSASGAFVRASNSGLVTVTRSAPADASAGTVSVEAGATLGASGSLLIDATQSASIAGNLNLQHDAALSLASSAVNLGDVPAGTVGLNLTQEQISSFSLLGSLTLKSYGAINVYGGGLTLGGAGLQNLTIDGAVLLGMTGGGASADNLTVKAGTITLTNSSAPQYLGAGSAGMGTLSLDATTVTIGAGAKTIAGFGSVDIDASSVQEQGVGSLQVAAPITIAANRVSGDSGANQTWIAQGLGNAGPYYSVTLAAPSQSATLGTATGLGAQLVIEGSDVIGQAASTNGNVNLVANAGSITLAAMGQGAGPGVQVGAGMVIDVSGASKTFVGDVAVADAGNITLTSDHGTVSLAAQSTLNVSGAVAGANAGSISLTGPAVALQGNLLGSAAPGQVQGSFSLDSGTAPDLSSLSQSLQASGFTQSIAVRARTGSLALNAGDTLTAYNVILSADAGSIDLATGARINASGPAGSSSVTLNAQGDIDLNAGSVIDASGRSMAAGLSAPLVNGGSVALTTTAGAINMAAGATIDVSAGAVGNAGVVSFTAPRSETSGGVTKTLSDLVTLKGTILSGTYQSTSQAEVDVYGSLTYSPMVAGVLSSTDLGNIIAANQSFMASVDAAGIASGLRGDGGAAIASQVHVRPAVIVQSSGDLTLDANDTGNIDLTSASWMLSNNNSSAPEAGTLTLRAAGNLTVSNVSIGLPDNNLYAGPTWNINLVGGADLSAANVMQTQSAAVLGTTGDVVLDGAQARVTSGTGNISIAAGHDFHIDNPLGVVYTSGAPVAGVVDSYERWATGGGNITITAQHDATGSSAEWINDWLRRTASGVNGDLGAWWAYRSNFEDGVGALGGGNVKIAAGNDINDLSAVIPTSGRLYSPNPLIIQVGRSKEIGPGPFYLDVEGGGNLSVSAGNDIVGGQYLVALGTGSIKAGGTIGANTATEFYLMGENENSARQVATLSVAAAGSVNVQSIVDPTELAQPASVGNDPSISANRFSAVNFLTYSANSEVSVKALGGDISVNGKPLAQVPLNPQDGAPGTGLFSDPTNGIEWPASVTLDAFQGSVTSSSASFVTYASPSGSINVLAGQSVTNLNLAQSDNPLPGTGANSLSNWRYPDGQNSITGIAFITGGITQFTSTAPFVDDIVALDGSVNNSIFLFPARSRIWAGDDVIGVQATLQNTNASDLSEIVANTGSIDPSQQETISVGGPGQLLVQAGSSILLPVVSGGPGLVATGNELNSSLQDATSARLTVVAGVTGPINLAGLDAAYAELITAGTEKDAALAAAAAASIFGNAKINAGDINSYLTSIQTQQGSGIDLLAPAGDITVGLTTPPSSTSSIGIITTSGGAINSYLSGNFNINQGKVLTLQGGNILIYTTGGSIDAGRGAKTSIDIPPPKRVPIFSGDQIIGYNYVVSSAAAGSGIQTLTSSLTENGVPARPAGSIYLFAPVGTVNAGEAGIESGGNIVIEAAQVLNASNISAAGTSTGVPVATTGSLASSLTTSGSNSSAGADQAAAEAARSAAANAAAGVVDSLVPAILTVDVLGFGQYNCKETDKPCLDK